MCRSQVVLVAIEGELRNGHLCRDDDEAEDVRGGSVSDPGDAPVVRNECLRPPIYRHNVKGVLEVGRWFGQVQEHVLRFRIICGRRVFEVLK